MPPSAAAARGLPRSRIVQAADCTTPADELYRYTTRSDLTGRGGRAGRSGGGRRPRRLVLRDWRSRPRLPSSRWLTGGSGLALRSPLPRKAWKRKGAARSRVKGSPSGPSEASREAVPLTRRARRYPEPSPPGEGCLRRRRVVEAADHGMGSTSGSWSTRGADPARGPYEHRPARREDPCRRRPADDLDGLRARNAVDGRLALEPTLAPNPVGCRARASTPCRRSIAAAPGRAVTRGRVLGALPACSSPGVPAGAGARRASTASCG